MDTLSLPAQPQAERALRAAAARNALSHALLITGGADRAAVARFAAAAMECTAASGVPCGVCAHCRKVLEGIHPDVTVVEDAAHKNISVDIIRAVRADAYVRPNEGKRKVCLFPDCALLTEQDQNVLLKLVEEGPPYASFIFCAENGAAVLPTLRSRCVEIKLRGEQRQTALSEEAAALCRALAAKKRGSVAALAVRLEKKKLSREALTELLAQTRDTAAQALMLRYGAGQKGGEIAADLAKNLTNAQIMRTIELLQKYHGECSYNVGTGHVLGALAAELEGIL